MPFPVLHDLPRRSLAFEACAFAFLSGALAFRLLPAAMALLAAASFCALRAPDLRGRWGLAFFGSLALGLLRGIVRDAGDLPPIGAFEWLRGRLLDGTETAFVPPTSHWASGLLIGEDGGFSRRWKDMFRETGTTHLTAVSGYNVGVVLEAARRGLSSAACPRRARLPMLLAAVACFIFLTGRPSSVIRAGLMTAAFEVARRFGRPLRPLRSLLLASLAVAAWRPSALLDDRGFQLSAAATFGLAALAPALQDGFFARWPGWLGSSAAQALAAGVATAPLIAWMSGSYALVGFAANVAVAPFIPFAMAASAVAALGAMLSAEAGRLLGTLLAPLVSLPLVVIGHLAEIPFAGLRGRAAAAALLIVEALCIAAIVRWRRRAARAFLL